MKCAYTDKEKTNLIPAKEASSNTIHYCEMIECPAEVYPASLDSIYQSAHFRTYKDISFQISQLVCLSFFIYKTYS